MSQQTRLVIFDFDGTLYDSPKPPGDHPTWWFQPYSLPDAGPPGFDRRWILPTVLAARQATNRLDTITAVLTARVDHDALRKRVMSTLEQTGLPFDIIQLKPLLFPGNAAAYKAAYVRDWLVQFPTVREVTLYEDRLDVLRAVEHSVCLAGRSFQGILVRSQSSR